MTGSSILTGIGAAPDEEYICGPPLTAGKVAAGVAEELIGPFDVELGTPLTAFEVLGDRVPVAAMVGLASDATSRLPSAPAMTPPIFSTTLVTSCFVCARSTAPSSLVTFATPSPLAIGARAAAGSLVVVLEACAVGVELALRSEVSFSVEGTVGEEAVPPTAPGAGVCVAVFGPSEDNESLFAVGETVVGSSSKRCEALSAARSIAAVAAEAM